MCEARVILEDGRGNEVETFEDITTIVPENGALKLFDLYGGHKTVAAELKEVRLLDHTVVLAKLGS
jgi:predicted RNA-binding protein